MTRYLLLLTAAIAVIGANSLVLSPIAASVAMSFTDVDAAEVMTAAAAYGLFTALSALLLAPRADRIGAERALVRALWILTVALAGTGMAPALWTLVVVQTLAGVAAGMALPAIYTLTAQVADKGRESEALGMVLTGWTISLVVGVGLSAVLADLLHWRAVFSLLAVVACLLALVIARLRGWGSQVHDMAPSTPLHALQVRGLSTALVNVAAYMMAFYGLYTYLGPHIGETLERSTAFAGLTIAAYGAGFGVAAPLGRLVDRYGMVPAACVSFAALAMVYLGLAVAAEHPLVLLILCAIWGVANHMGLNLLVRRLTELDPAQRGAIMGLYSATTYLCVFAGALLYRPILNHAGFATCALVSALFILPALVWALSNRRPASRLRQG
ncbi:MFS transporter [Aidingimonas lacisalsi]|uniref:MFS transporter n=1 Tax=Aidingimonas lacisalsi TaxID=2604086 RepID=UPI0011D1DA77|nr:MFS transporter [Aidingimonas lacisalsi]